MKSVQLLVNAVGIITEYLGHDRIRFVLLASFTFP